MISLNMYPTSGILIVVGSNAYFIIFGGILVMPIPGLHPVYLLDRLPVLHISRYTQPLTVYPEIKS